MFKLTKYIFCGLFILIASSLALPGYAAKGGSHGKYNYKIKKEKPKKYYKAQKPKKLSKFDYSDKNVITDYFNTHRYRAKPLPPGIAMNLARGKPLPPGIAKRGLPGNLRGLLPERPGYEYFIAGNDVLLVNTANNIIADIISNVIK